MSIRRVVEAFAIPTCLSHPGAEADDVIATLAHCASERGMDVVICTADKDARQLLDEHTRILNLPGATRSSTSRASRPTGALPPSR